MKTFITFRVHIILLYLSVFFLVSTGIGGNLNKEEVIAGLMAACLMQAAYVYNKTRDTREDIENNEKPVAFPKILRYVSLTFVAGISFYWVKKYPQLFPVLLFGFISILAYSEETFKFKGLPFVKPFINAMGFFLLSVLTPVLINDPLAYNYVGIVFVNSLELVLIVFIISTLFDIRDVKGDFKAGLKTIPVIIGSGPTAVFLAFISGILAFWDFKKADFAGCVNNFIVSAYALGALKKRKPFYYASLVLVEILFVCFLIWKNHS